MLWTVLLAPVRIDTSVGQKFSPVRKLVLLKTLPGYAFFSLCPVILYPNDSLRPGLYVMILQKLKKNQN